MLTYSLYRAAMDIRAFSQKEASRLIEQLGDGADAEARYRLTVARNRRDLLGIERWSAVSAVLFELRFHQRPMSAAAPPPPAR